MTVRQLICGAPSCDQPSFSEDKRSSVVFYKVVKPFGPDSGAVWGDYLAWIHQKQMTSFDSVDAGLRADCFNPETNEDWKHCVNEDHKLNLLIDLDYARKIQRENPDSEIVGVEVDVEATHVPRNGLCGYDILDEWCAVSLLTNWGTSEPVFEGIEFQANGLLRDISIASRMQTMLREHCCDDPHAKNCQVWAIYKFA